MNAVLHLAAVSRVHGEGATEVHALRGVTFRAHPGELVAVMGPSGSGKFTLLSRVRTGNGSVHFTIAVTQPGFYAWQVQTSPGDLWLGSRSTCAAGGTVVTTH